MGSARPIAAHGTDAGRERENNEDRVLFDPERGIYAVIDGVGGESGGEIAAETAREVLAARLARRTTDLDRLIREAIALANRKIFERAQADPRLSGMSCVLTVAMLDGDHATVGHVGDSRMYLLRRGEIRKVTRDHSPVGAREDSGELSEDEAMHHPRRNEIFRDVGSAPHEPEDEGFVDVEQVPFSAESAFLICSDGLSDLVPSARMREIVESHAGDPKAAVDHLIDEANAAGGKDNISIVLVEGERYAAAVRTGAPVSSKPVSPKPVSSTTVSTVPAVAAGQYGAAHVRSSWLRRMLPWLLLLALCAAVGAVILTPALRHRVAGLLYPSETPAPAPAPASSDLPAVLRVGSGETDFATIGEALSAAHSGQTVEVAPGEYRAAVTLPDGVALVSRMPLGAVLFLPLDAPAGSAVITARGTSGRISGFRIVGTAEDPIPVGLRLDGAQVQVAGMDIRGMDVAGIESTGEDRSTVESSYLHDNPGSAVIVSGGAATILRQNQIVRNGKAKKTPGVEVRGNARPVLVDNRFAGNAAASVWLPTAERIDEVFDRNAFGGVAKVKAVRVAPQAPPPAPSAPPATQLAPTAPPRAGGNPGGNH